MRTMQGDLRGLPAAARRDRMRSLIERRGFALVTDLARMFEISEVTVRTDLDALAESHAVRRVHGGAMSAEKSPWLEPTFDKAAEKRVEEKSRIGRAAAALVDSHQVIALDAGITNTSIGEADVKRRMIATAARSIVVADSSKLGAVRASRVCGVEDPALLVTGSEADRPGVAALRDAGLDVELA